MRTRYLSIHFPLTREDLTEMGIEVPADTFNPLPSHEGRLCHWWRGGSHTSFNPLPSHEGRQQKALIFPSKTALFQAHPTNT